MVIHDMCLGISHITFLYVMLRHSSRRLYWMMSYGMAPPHPPRCFLVDERDFIIRHVPLHTGQRLQQHGQHDMFRRV